jgi:iron complex transport system substrate-binding protein
VKPGFLLVFSLILLLPLSCPAPRKEPPAGTRDSSQGIEAMKTPEKTLGVTTEFFDDDKNKIEIQKPFARIIPLYSAHVENLFAIGAGASVIGVPRGTDYPPEAAALPAFDYNGDPEYIIGAEPDLVLIRPFVRRQSPDYIKKIEDAGIPVVSLYPESFESFDTYILRLGMLSGKLSEAEEKLKVFHGELAEIRRRTEGIQKKKTVFFESTDNEIRTAAADSLPAKAIEFAGGKNAAPSLPPMSAGSSIARFGAEALLGIADNIDVYVVQQGAMNRSKGFEALRSRPGFNAVKAVREGQVLFINERLISSVTFRYLEGVKILAEYLYPGFLTNPDTSASIGVVYNNYD